jgi:hypothetical protein
LRFLGRGQPGALAKTGRLHRLAFGDLHGPGDFFIELAVLGQLLHQPPPEVQRLGPFLLLIGRQTREFQRLLILVVQLERLHDEVHRTPVQTAGLERDGLGMLRQHPGLLGRQLGRLGQGKLGFVQALQGNISAPQGIPALGIVGFGLQLAFQRLDHCIGIVGGMGLRQCLLLKNGRRTQIQVKPGGQRRHHAQQCEGHPAPPRTRRPWVRHRTRLFPARND